MKRQEIMLNRALDLLERNLIIIGGDFRIDCKREEWAGNRYHLLEEIESLTGQDGYDFEKSDDFVVIRLIGSKEENERKMILIKDFL